MPHRAVFAAASRCSSWVLAGLLAVAACTPAAPAPADATTASADDAEGLHVELRVTTPRVARVAELRTTITLTNRAAAPRRLFLEYVPAGNLSLEVQGPDGQRVPPLPPPVPHVDDGVRGWATLAPGESRSFEVGSSVGVDVPDGSYRVRFQGVPGDRAAGHLQSGWVSFDVRK
jgi:hypothetical protein